MIRRSLTLLALVFSAFAFSACTSVTAPDTTASSDFLGSGT